MGMGQLPLPPASPARASGNSFTTLSLNGASRTLKLCSALNGITQFYGTAVTHTVLYPQGNRAGLGTLIIRNELRNVADHFTDIGRMRESSAAGGS
jgi:hypothetical protein